MGQASIETYLKNMKLKKKAFGGYDPEDVILKMQELVRLAGSDDGGRSAESCRELEAALTEQKEKCRAAETALAKYQQAGAQPGEELLKRLKTAESAMTASESKRLAAEAKAAQLELQLQKVRNSGPNYAGEAEKLHALLDSLESAKADILKQYTEKAVQESERLKREAVVLQHSNAEMKRLLADEIHSLSRSMDSLLQEAQQLKVQISSLECENG